MSGAADFFRQMQRDLHRLEVEIAQQVIAVEAEQFHAENFRKEGFTDTGLQKWKPRKELVSPRRALLVKTGKMRRAATKGRKHGSQIDFVFPSSYMRVHNEGGRSGRGLGFRMPKRQFVGRSQLLERRIERKVRGYLNRYLNGT